MTLATASSAPSFVIPANAGIQLLLLLPLPLLVIPAKAGNPLVLNAALSTPLKEQKLDSSFRWNDEQKQTPPFVPIRYSYPPRGAITTSRNA